MSNFKVPKIRDKKWLAAVREMPCTVCSQSPSDPAHIRKFTDGGTSLKPSDCYILPLCRSCHTRQHSTGEITFWGGEDGVRDAIKTAIEAYDVFCSKK